MINLRPILMVTGVLLGILSFAMLFPALADALSGHGNWIFFLVSAFLTGFVGGALYLTNQGQKGELTIKQAFLLTTISWLTLVIFAALPFMFCDIHLSFSDAFFESMSGITTTGATVIISVDNVSKGILLWRAILQWLGGIGIIVMAMSLLPLLKIGGMQLFRTESSDTADKVLPRAQQVANAILGVYFILTVLCFGGMWLAGMKAFDALAHALTTVSTGGFSTHNMSIGYYDSPIIEVIMTIFMLLGSIPFVLYIQMLRGRTLALWMDSQVRWFFIIVIISVGLAFCWLVFGMRLPVGLALRESSFNVISIITTSGFSTMDYNIWGDFAITALFLLTVVGGCTGSTAGGIKIFRFQVLFSSAQTQVYQLMQPHGVFRPMFNGKPISENIMSSVMSFIIFFGFIFSLLAILLGFTGLDYLSSMSTAASMIANVGPGLGPHVGPAGNFAFLTDSAKWICSFGMLIGRLEIFTILVLLSPRFWRT